MGWHSSNRSGERQRGKTFGQRHLDSAHGTVFVEIASSDEPAPLRQGILPGAVEARGAEGAAIKTVASLLSPTKALPNESSAQQTQRNTSETEDSEMFEYGSRKTSPPRKLSAPTAP